MDVAFNLHPTVAGDHARPTVLLEVGGDPRVIRVTLVGIGQAIVAESIFVDRTFVESRLLVADSD